MSTLVVHLETEAQEKAVKAFLEASQIDFEKEVEACCQAISLETQKKVHICVYHPAIFQKPNLYIRA